MKQYHIDYTEESIANLEEIGKFIAQDSHDRAISFIENLTAYIDSTLSIFPYASTTKYPDYPTVRMVPYRRYNIYYQILEDAVRVEILHIYNAAKQPSYET